jgi:hypothetical protein
MLCYSSHHMHRFNMVNDHLPFSLAAAQSLVLQDLEGYSRLQRLNNNERKKQHK